MLSAPPRSEVPKLAELPLVIESPRLRLRPITIDDAAAYFPLTSDPRISKWTTWGAHATIDDTREWLRSAAAGVAQGDNATWAIEHEGKVVGCIGLHGIVWQFRAIRYDRAELGYWLAPAEWGKGIATEAATHVVRWGFETLGLHKINVMCLEDNEGSRRVIENVGFRFLCKLEDDGWRDGRWHAHLRYELLASEWADSTRTLRFRRG
jgi:ribosomal-protein-alanine N-acetyltransferase